MSATGTMRKRIVHLDLKGAPPKPDYYKELFGLFQQLKLTGVLIEYEDMFPYSGRLASLSGPLAYEPITIQYINTLAAEHNLEVIPLIQTFGHMEFVLKQEGPFTDLREVPERADTICPSDHRSLKLIKEMLTQVWLLHPHARTIHIGSDEAWSIAQDQRCLDKLHNVFHNSTDRLKLDHISSVAKIAKNELKFEKCGPGTICAFKGAQQINSTFMNVDHYMANLISYNTLFIKHQHPWLEDRLSGMILTGWQRFSHSTPLCELFPVGIPCLIIEALYLAGWNNKSAAPTIDHKKFLVGIS
uniref:beta-N-acetylhexosaminidase n=1 Tax=Ditylenchus dipsaci TaxID=166011 RepID=A0A915DT83_9BILA